MNLPVQATVEQFDMPRTCGAGVLRIGIARPSGLEGRTDVPALVVTDADLLFALAAEAACLHGSVVPAAISRALSFSLPDPV
jgi:hypothetical protein